MVTDDNGYRCFTLGKAFGEVVADSRHGIMRVLIETDEVACGDRRQVDIRLGCSGHGLVA